MKLTSHRPEEERDRWVSTNADWREAQGLLMELRDVADRDPQGSLPRRLARIHDHLMIFLGEREVRQLDEARRARSHA